MRPSGANRARSRSRSVAASPSFVGPTAATFHSAPSMSSSETKVGSPPMVSRTSPAARRRSTASPSVSIAAHCSSLYGLVERGDSAMRDTDISCEKSTSQSSTAPLIAAAACGSGVAASGRWPSAARRPDVGSSPTQPAPGTKTSAQACRSVRSPSGPEGPSSARTSGRSWIRYPETKRAARPRWRRHCTRSQPLSRQEPEPLASVSSGVWTPGSRRIR